MMACIQGTISAESRGHQHDKCGPPEQNRPEIAQRVEGPENVEKNFVNHLKTQHRANRVAEPVKVEKSPIIVLEIRWENQAEDQDLGHHVGEEELELAVQAAPQHDHCDTRLDHGVRDPKSVIDDPGFLVHR
jgi:hypothetical protein